MSEQQTDRVTDTGSSDTVPSDTGSSDTGSEETTTRGQDSAGRPGEIADDQLPEDLQPGEDNPLARHPDQTGDEGDRIGADREEAAQTAPMQARDAEYGSGGGSDDDKGGGTSPGEGRVDASEDDGSDALEHGGGGAG